MDTKNGGPVFPSIMSGPNNMTGGMSLRDYFAAHAPQPTDNEIGSQQSIDRSRNPHNDGPPKPQLRSREQVIAFLRYQYADAMLKERSK
jgi:hypothetical protein